LTASDADIATLDQVKETARESEPYSPLGQLFSDYLEEKMARDPEFRKYMEEPRPYFPFSQCVGILRLEQELSLEEVARRTGLSVEAVSRLESDRQVPTDDDVAKLSKALGHDLARHLPAPAERAA
jgi:ribosome-binding protein aMBF1 (putative translation factor)